MGWQYYGSLAGVTDADINALPAPPVPMPQTIDALFIGKGGIPLTGGGLVTQNNVKMALAKIAYKLYGLPLTVQTIQAVPLRWASGTDVFDTIRPVLSKAAVVVGGALAGVTGGASLIAGSLVSKAIANNAQTQAQADAANAYAATGSSINATDISNFVTAGGAILGNAINQNNAPGAIPSITVPLGNGMSVTTNQPIKTQPDFLTQIFNLLFGWL